VTRLERNLYMKNEIPSAVYPNLLSKTAPTVSVNAVFYVSTEWKAQNPGGAKLLSSTLLDLLTKRRPFAPKESPPQ